MEDLYIYNDERRTMDGLVIRNEEANIGFEIVFGYFMTLISIYTLIAWIILYMCK